MLGPDQKTTELLQRLHSGDAAARMELSPRVFDDLHAIAERLFAKEPTGHTLQATALVNEAWLRVGTSSLSDGHKESFLKLAAHVMRNILVDHARRKATAKRGGALERLPFDEILGTYEDRKLDLVGLDEVLSRLGELDPDLLAIVELRFFAGLTLEEISQLHGYSTASVHRKWKFAQAWLNRELSD